MKYAAIAALLGVSVQEVAARHHNHAKLIQVNDDGEFMRMAEDPVVLETKGRIADLRQQLSEEEHDTYRAPTEYDEKTETSNFIDAYASKVEKKERLRSVGDLEHKINSLKARDVNSLTEDQKDSQMEHITEQEQ